jgi:hypothetical protein
MPISCKDRENPQKTVKMCDSSISLNSREKWGGKSWKEYFTKLDLATTNLRLAQKQNKHGKLVFI